MPVYNLKRLTPVPTSSELVDIVLMRTQRKTPTVIHPGYKISRIRSFYMRKIKFTTQTISERLGAIVGDFPRLDEVHPFFGDLLGVLYDRDHYKLALGQLNTCKKLCESVCRDYVRLLKYADSLYRCKSLKVAALGRMMTLLKRQKASLEYLEEVRKHAGRLPALDPSARTLLVCGFPNVGKSSFMNKITRAQVDVQPYAFTTKSLYVGHMDHRYLRWQVIDTPGILDHELEKRNVIEMQAVTALAHLPCAILFFVDVSEQCGYTLEQQSSLYHSIRALFTDKQLVIVANKTDIIALNDLSPEHQQLLKNMCTAHTNHDQQHAPLIEMSNITETGVTQVKDTACDLLLAARVDKRKSFAAGARVRDQMQRIVVAKPTKMAHAPIGTRPANNICKQNNIQSKAHIPESVKAARRALRLEKEAQLAIEEASRVESALDTAREHGAREAAVLEVSERAQRAKERAERLAAQAASNTTMTDEKKPTERELMWLGGGPGVYSADLSREYKGMLRHDEYISDVIPEIMDGKNVADFVDPDIITRLSQLEDEDLEAELALDEAERLEIEASLSPQELELMLAIRAKRKLARQKSQAKQHTAQGNHIIPRSKRSRIEDTVDEDLPDSTHRARDAVIQRGRSRSRSRRADNDDAMDTTSDHNDDLPRRATKKARTRSTSRPPPRSEAAFPDPEQKKTAQKVERKMAKKVSRLAKAGEINRKTGPKLERWRVEGKMGLGTRRSR